MKWLGSIWRVDKAERLDTLKRIQGKFALFRSLLDEHNRALKVISRLEERAQAGQAFEISSIRSDLADVQEGVERAVEKMIELGGEHYAILKDRLTLIRSEIEKAGSPRHSIGPDELVVPFSRLDRERAISVGTKNANLGEMRSRLGLPIPDGFAITAWAYRQFVESNRLEERIAKLFKGIVIRHYEDLDVVSEEIRELVLRCPVPVEVANAIEQGYDDLVRRSQNSVVALRSSAIAEDTFLTFAGQYVTFLGVTRDALLDRYREILASKFTPAAIHYLLSHTLFGSDLAMSVGCTSLVDAAASGVIYTRDPLNPGEPYALVNAILGLGAYLVSGVVTPDVFHVSREEPRVVFSDLAKKTVRLVYLSGSGALEEPVPSREQMRASINEEQLALLTRYALRVEAHYGAPQDIEWAIDRQGRLFLLQARPLRVRGSAAAEPVRLEPRDNLLLSGATTVCPGAGAGPVFHLESTNDLERVPRGAVLVVPNPSPILIRALSRVAAVVSEVGGVASHLATLAREIGVPTVAGAAGARELPMGQIVTVDATRGAIYQGLHPQLIAGSPPRLDAGVDARTLEVFRRIVAKVAHLNLRHPSEPNFVAEKCDTLHDITRFIHQKAMEEMFQAVKKTQHKDRIGCRLKTTIPLVVDIVVLDKDPETKNSKRWIAEDQIESIPMRALWGGVKQEGWPSRPVAADLKGFMAVVGTNLTQGHQPEFSENSYAFLSKEYMLLNLRMGYHFATIEALATPEPAKNYVRMQYKDGGAPLERRIRRIKLISELLARTGFENYSQGDFLDAMLSYVTVEDITRCLRIVGRINIMTKQLDMALANDSVAQWYTDDFIKRLGLQKRHDERTEAVETRE